MTVGNVIGHERGVAADAADEVRTAVVLEALTEHVQARDRRAAAALADLARAVEHRQPQPRVGTPVAGRPDDGADTGGAKVEVRDGAWPGRRWGCDLPRASRGRARWPRCTGRCAGAAVACAGQRRRPWRAGRGEPHPVTVDREHPADQPDLVGLQGGQVEPPVVGPADQLGGWLVPREQAVGHLVDRGVEEAEAVEPPEDVHAAVGARHAGVAADGDRHVAAGRPELVGELDAGRRGADHQHAPVRQRAGVAVLARHHLVNVRGQGARRRRHGGPVAPAGGDDDVGGQPGRPVGADLEPVVPLAQQAHGRVLLDGRVERVGVPGEVPAERGRGPEPVRVGAAVGLARQGVHPVRGQQVQRVPGVAAPALPDPATLEHDVVTPAVGQAAAGGQAGLARADDDGVGDAHRCSRRCEVLAGPAAQRDRPTRRDAVTCRQPASTSMDTGTPLVTTSKTADRWRDCSTT